MSVGFDGMQIAHIIDEVVFDFTFVSTSVPVDHESKMSAWIIDQILPAVDTVFDEIDEAKTVLRLDLVEIDLGDVTEEAFQTVLVRRLKEKLSGMLQGIREHSGVLNSDIALPSRVSYAQVDLQQLQSFLMTGRMAWHVNISSRQAHEKILERVLQEQSDVFIRFLKQSTARSTLIDRLVKQFTEPYLVQLLQKAMPIHAALTLNLLEIYRVTITEKRFSSASNAASIDVLWVSIFAVVLDPVFVSKDQATVANAVVEKLKVSLTSDSADVMKKMQRVATRLKLEKKIDAVLPKILTDVRERCREVVKAKDGRKTGARLQKKAQKKERAAQYQRIINALKAAEVRAFHPLLQGFRQHPIKIFERLATQGKQAAMREQLAEKLTDEILLDITGLFIPVAVSYLKQLLAQSSILHQGVGEAVWKKQLWESNLSYMFIAPNAAFVPANYLKSLASGMSPTQDAPSVLRIWLIELSTTTSAQSTEPLLLNLLQQLVADEDHYSLPQVIDHTPTDSDAYMALMQRLQQGVPREQNAQSLQPVIAELIHEYPEQCQRIYDAIRDGALSMANLNTREQRQLLIAFIDQTPVFDAENRAILIQAITRHADGAADPSVYYQQILQALLHDQSVDLEAMQKQKAIIFGEKDTIIEPLEVEAELRVKEAATTDRSVQYQRIVQALKAVEVGGLQLSSKGLRRYPVKIRQLLATKGKQIAMQRQLAKKLADDVLLDITDLFAPAAVSYIKQLLVQSAVLHQGVGEAIWRQRLWESNLNYLFTEATPNFVPADYLKALGRLMSPSNDAPSVLLVWHKQLSVATPDSQLAEQPLASLLQQLIPSEEAALTKEHHHSQSESEAYKTLVQRLQQGVSRDAQPLQSVMAKLAQDHSQHLIRVYEAIRGGTLSTARLNATDQRQLLMAFIDQAPAFNAENRVTFIQAIENQADHAIDHSTYYRLILQALLHDQPVDLESLAKQSDSSESLAVRIDESTTSDVETSAQTVDQRPVFDEYGVAVPEQDIEAKEMIEISNAGQIIAAPYLPRLFQMLKLLNNEGMFVSFEAAERAVHLLQFMVNEQSESPEYLLILNKILCGIPTTVSIRRQLDFSDHEKTVVEDLIKGMIQNWKAIGSTSVSGFRETFLQRDGGLFLEDDAWHLTVHPGTFDMLLDGLPWSFSIVKHAWMDKAIHVDWR